MHHEKALAALLKLEAGAEAQAVGGGFEGHWTNQYESLAKLEVNGSTVSGTYRSKVSSTGDEIEGPVIGHVSGDIIGFSVLWPTKAGSITTWVGQVVVEDDGVEVLRTLWHLVVNIPDAKEPKGLWTTVYTGADAFTRPAPK